MKATIRVTSVDSCATTENSILSNSVIGSFLSCAVMHYPIIGSDAGFKGSSHSLIIGNSTEIDFGQ